MDWEETLGRFLAGFTVGLLRSREEAGETAHPSAMMSPPSSWTPREEAGRTFHPLARLAKLAVEQYVSNRRIMTIPDDLPEDLSMRAGVFVSIKKRGELRGCIGTYEPMTPSIVHEVARNAVSAACQDPRFPPVREGELAHLNYSVDVLTSPESVNGIEHLDPAVYGVLVVKGYQRGLLLPDLEGIDSAEQQVDIARRKAGIPAGESVQLFRFRVKRCQ